MSRSRVRVCLFVWSRRELVVSNVGLHLGGQLDLDGGRCLIHCVPYDYMGRDPNLSKTCWYHYSEVCQATCGLSVIEREHAGRIAH